MKLDNQKLGLNLPQTNGLKRQLLIEIVEHTDAGSFRSSVQLDNSRYIWCIYSGFDAICSVVITNKSKARVEANLVNCGMFSLGFFCVLIMQLQTTRTKLASKLGLLFALMHFSPLSSSNPVKSFSQMLLLLQLCKAFCKAAYKSALRTFRSFWRHNTRIRGIDVA